MTETVFEVNRFVTQIIVRADVEPGIEVRRVEPKEEPEYPDRDAAGDEEC